jgi:dTMP kinase
MRPGSLIVFEGLDGSGLTTQATHLAEHIAKSGGRVVHTAEPSEGPVGALLKTMLARDDVSLRTLSLLFAADRADHQQRLVEPALLRGDVVVCERWYPSSLAYQRSGIDRDWIIGLNAHSRRPDVIVFLVVHPEVARKRREAAGRPTEYFQRLSTQMDVAAGYKATIAELISEGERVEIVDGERAVDEVHNAVLRAVSDLDERTEQTDPRRSIRRRV